MKKYLIYLDQLLHLAKPFVRFLPEVSAPLKGINFQERFVWTSVALLIYLISSQVPLFGIMSSSSADPLYWMRVMMASNKGTLMDLGISPVVTSSMIMQILMSSSLLNVDFSIKEDKILYNALQKIIAIIMTVGQAVVQVISGFYGDPESMGPTVCILLVCQLIFSGIIVILLDELLSKGYGLGSGVNLFIATNVCENIIWKAFSPKVFNTARGAEFEGCIISLLHLLVTRKNKFSAVYEAFFRKNLPNCSTLIITFLIFSSVIYLQGIRMDVPTESTNIKGQTGKYPIKLLYSSTTPIVLQSYFISHTSMISRILYTRFPNFFLIRLLGVWLPNKFGRLIPVSGLCYFIYPPESIWDFFKKPVSFLTYCTVTLMSSAFLSRTWIDISENNQFNIAKQLKNNRMTIKGIREQYVPTYLSRYIPSAAFIGGFFTGLICLLSNLFDTIGSGTNIFLAVSIIWQYLEAFTKENLKNSGAVCS